MAKVLIACEESQVVCKAFRERGYEAYSNDIIECSGGHPEWHIQGDAIKEAYSGKYTLMIGHPPCTYLSFAANASWNDAGRIYKRLEALKFFADLWEAPIPFICLENPKSCASPIIAKYTQEIQPYYFGDNHLKTTWLWLKNLPKLEYIKENNLFWQATTSIKRVEPCSIDNTKRMKKRYFTDSAARKSIDRSKTFPGIANAMADQWGKLL